MRAALFALVCCLNVAGCATIDTAQEPLPPLTPAQRYYAADRAYETLLETAVEYHDDCIRTPDRLKGNCMEVVQVLRRVNREAQDARLLAEMAMTDGEVDLLAEATKELEHLRDRLRRELADKLAEEESVP